MKRRFDQRENSRQRELRHSAWKRIFDDRGRWMAVVKWERRKAELQAIYQDQTDMILLSAWGFCIGVAVQRMKCGFTETYLSRRDAP